MTDTIFQEAYARVRAAFSEEAWLALNPRQITDAIYREIRAIDEERLRATRAARSSDDTDPSPK